MMKKQHFGRKLLMGLAAATLFGVPVALSGGISSGSVVPHSSGTGFKIGYSNSMLGNTFHEVLISNAETTLKDAKREGYISQYTITDANNSAATQAQQIRSFIVEHYNAIIVDASSATALNLAIQQACNAGIIVVAVNEIATAPCAYKITNHYPIETELQMLAMGKALHGKGNILDDAGIAGTAPEAPFHQGVELGLKQYPGLKLVGTVYGQWTTTITDQVISTALPSLPAIQGVVSEGAGEVGVVDAFKAAHRPLPYVYFGNAGQDLRVWKSMLSSDPAKFNNNLFSISSFPSISGAGIWTAIALLQHKVASSDFETGRTFYFPLLAIKQNYLNGWIKDTPFNSQATYIFSYPQTLAILALRNKAPQVVYPVPGGGIPGIS